MTDKGNSQTAPFAHFTATNPVPGMLAMLSGLKENNPGNQGCFAAIMHSLCVVGISDRPFDAIEIVANAAKILDRLGSSAVDLFMERSGAQLMLNKSIAARSAVRTYELAGQTLEAIAGKAQRHGPHYLHAWKLVFAGALLAIPHITFSGDPLAFADTIEETAKKIGLGKGKIMTEVLTHLSPPKAKVSDVVANQQTTGKTDLHASER